MCGGGVGGGHSDTQSITVQKTSGMVQMDEGPLMGQSGVLERVAYFVPHGWCLNSTISGNKIKAL